MKPSHIITLIVAALFFAGCASKETASTTEEAAPMTGSANAGAAAGATDSGAHAKTAYEGSTGSGLLMERYKAGSIEGYRD